MQGTTRNVVFVMIAVGILVAGAATGKANPTSGSAAEEPVAAHGQSPEYSSQSFNYYPAQYTLNAPDGTREHIQAF